MSKRAADNSRRSKALIKPRVIIADARQLPIAPKSVDLIITSPPYWHKRNYGVPNQIGQELTVQLYISSLIEALREWRRVLRPSGSIFMNVGDTYLDRSLVGIPGLIEASARAEKWIIRNRIVWAKTNGIPESAKNRLANRHEYILHLTPRHDYYYDIVGYTEHFGNGGNPGDVWNVKSTYRRGRHLAPFPDEIVERAVTLACPLEVCTVCGKPRTRIVRRTTNLNPNRPQARRALELAKEKGLTAEHIAAIQATGISDVGKATHFQNGAGRNSARVQELAAEAKQALGGYFREFTFAQPETIGWNNCGCGQEMSPGVILDPFMGTGTTLRVANRLGRLSIGVDLVTPYDLEI